MVKEKQIADHIVKSGSIFHHPSRGLVWNQLMMRQWPGTMPVLTSEDSFKVASTLYKEEKQYRTFDYFCHSGWIKFCKLSALFCKKYIFKADVSGMINYFYLKNNLFARNQ